MISFPNHKLERVSGSFDLRFCLSFLCTQTINSLIVDCKNLGMLFFNVLYANESYLYNIQYFKLK